MTALAGTPALIRFVASRDRIRIPVWVAAVAGLVLLTASSVQGLYPTQAALRKAAGVVENNPAAVAMSGPARALGTLGGRIALEVAAYGAIAVALMSVFLVARHTRAEEESGRTELVRAAAVGRHAATTATLVVAAAANLAVAAAVAAGMIALDLPVAGSLALGAMFGAVGLVFAGFTAVAAQVTEHTRGVYGIGVTAVGLVYVLRAAGDVGDGTLSWLSPIGWGQAMRPYAGERWWPLLLSVGVAAALTGAAFALGSRRDVGAGLVRPRPGRPAAPAGLTRPIGLALRLHRGSLLA